MSLKLLSLMLAHGCDVHRISDYLPVVGPSSANASLLAGSSMLFCAAHEGKLEVVQLLLSHHADPLQKCTGAGSYEGQTPLSVAMDHGDHKIVALLREVAFTRYPMVDHMWLKHYCLWPLVMTTTKWFPCLSLALHKLLH